MFDERLNLNLDNSIPNIKKAFIQVFSNYYQDIIDERLSNCRIIYYMNEKAYKDYYEFLVDCKIKELRIKFYNNIGLLYDKYKTENSGKIHDENLDLRTLNIRFNYEEDSKDEFASSIKKVIDKNKSLYEEISIELDNYKKRTKELLNKKIETENTNYQEYIDNNEVIELIENKQVKVLYTLINNGENDLVFLHMLCHVISTNNNKIGIEDTDLNIIDNKHSNKRKYELFNEVLTDIFADEARNYLHGEHIYICEEKDKCTKKDSNLNTAKELKDLVLPLLDLVPLELKRAYIENNIEILTDVIDEKNFLKINDLLDKMNILINTKKLDIDKYNNLKEEYIDSANRTYQSINDLLTKKD